MASAWYTYGTHLYRHIINGGMHSSIPRAKFLWIDLRENTILLFVRGERIGEYAWFGNPKPITHLDHLFLHAYHGGMASNVHRHTRSHRGNFARVLWCWCGVAFGFFDKSSYASMRRRLYGTAHTTYTLIHIECMHNIFNCKQAMYAHTHQQATAHTLHRILCAASLLPLSISLRCWFCFFLLLLFLRVVVAAVAACSVFLSYDSKHLCATKSVLWLDFSHQTTLNESSRTFVSRLSIWTE